MFCVSRDELYKLRVQRDELDPLYPHPAAALTTGAYRVPAHRRRRAGHVGGYTVERVKELLKRLWQLRVIRYIPSNRSPILFLNEERLPRADLYIAPRNLPAAAAADARTVRTDGRLRRQRRRMPQRGAGTLFRRGRSCALRGLRRVPARKLGRQGRRTQSRRGCRSPIPPPCAKSSCNASPTPPPTRGSWPTVWPARPNGWPENSGRCSTRRDPNDAGRQARTFRRS